MNESVNILVEAFKAIASLAGAVGIIAIFYRFGRFEGVFATELEGLRHSLEAFRKQNDSEHVDLRHTHQQLSEDLNKLRERTARTEARLNGTHGR